MGYWPSVRSRWLDIGQVPFLYVYGPGQSWGPWTHKKERGQYPAILTEKAWSINRASGRSQKKSQISQDFQGQIRGKNGRFRGNFAGILKASFAAKTIGKERPISWELPEQISLESDLFCADLRKVFNETRCSYSLYSGSITQYEIVLYKQA